MVADIEKASMQADVGQQSGQLLSLLVGSDQ